MTTSREIRELIAEQASSPAERKALEGVAERVEDALSQDVPYRPEFKAELRRKLMAQARRQSPPSLLRRPVFWGSAMGMAAAVGILAVGLSLWNNPPATPPSTPPGQQVPVGPGRETVVNPISSFPEIPRLAQADEQLPAGHPGAESLAGLDLSQGLMVYELGGTPDEAQFRKIAAGLKFTSAIKNETDGWSISQDARSLKLGRDGHVTYAFAGTEPAGARVVDASAAVAAAERFLFDASLPISGPPVVLEGTPGGRRMYKVTYTRRVDGRPVTNLPTIVTVSDRGTVVDADSYVQFVESPRGKGAVITPDEARATAEKRGGSFGSVDLVYVRTRSESGAYYLQPYWRAFGTGVVRYVPSLKE